MSFILLSGCTSQTITIKEPDPNRKYEKVGYASGTDAGILLFGFIPIGFNGRLSNAYIEAYKFAVNSHDADALINIDINEKWYNFFIFIKLRTTVSGEAIKYIGKPK